MTREGVAATMARSTLTESIFGLTLLGLPVGEVAEYLGVTVAAVRRERDRCREVGRDVIAERLLREADRG